MALAYVAGGRVAAYMLFWTSAIHAAAGSLLAAEAGAVVSDVDGEPWTLESDSILAIATNGDDLEPLGVRWRGRGVAQPG